MPVASPDTLLIDSLTRKAFQEAGEYAYYRDIVRGEKNLWQLIGEWIENLLKGIFGNEVYQDNAEGIWLILCLVILIGLAACFWRFRVRIFGKRETLDDVVSTTEDTIYGVDFDGQLLVAMQTENYKEVVRLAYLKTLRVLSDNGRVQWLPQKTPSDYGREVNHAGFSTFTLQFVRVRYGNYPADKALAEYMQAEGRNLADELTKGGDR